MSSPDDRLEERPGRNVARFFVENGQLTWVLIVAVVLGGLRGYASMPKQKDPTIPVRVATAITPWPGVDAHEIELLVTRPVESAVSQNSHVHPPRDDSYGTKSLTLPGMSIVQIQLDEDVQDTEEQFSDINLRLDALNSQLPDGAGPVQFNSGFGDTSALMLTIASPPERETSLALRARAAEQALRSLRAEAAAPAAGDARGPPGEGLPDGAGTRATLFVMVPRAVPTRALVRSVLTPTARAVEAAGVGRDVRVIEGAAFVGLDAIVPGDPADLLEFAERYAQETLRIPTFHPDAWQPFVVRDPGEIAAAIRGVAGPRFTYRQLDDVSDLVARVLGDVAQVSKVLRTGVLSQEVELVYDQEQLAALGVPLGKIAATLAQRNTDLAGGTMQARGAQLLVSPTGEFDTTEQIANVVVSQTPSGAPVYLRDLGQMRRGYQDPPTLLNSYAWRETDGTLRRGPAVTLSVHMRDGEQIAAFGTAVEAALSELTDRLPEDLVFARTSNQTRQVAQNVDLFLEALYEAILLVVLIALVGFKDWRSALLMMLSIPLTLCLTFAIVAPLGIAIQQISIASLIIALGLLVDDPVVAGDAIKRGIAAGEPRRVAAWTGPTSLSKAILFATLTNIVAYLPFVLLTGAPGEFLSSLPIVMAAALLSSRLVSLTFVPFLGGLLLRAGRRELPIGERRRRGFARLYVRVGGLAIRHRWVALVLFLALLGGSLALGRQLETSFFPEDVQYLSTIDVWLPNDASIFRTRDAVERVEATTWRVAEQARADGTMEGSLVNITSFIGGASPRFWQTLTPKLQQPNYASLIVQVEHRDDTPRLAPILQQELSATVPGALVDVKQLQTNPVEYPVAFRISGRAVINEMDADTDIATLRRLGDELAEVVRKAPSARRVRTDWLDEQFGVRVEVDPDLANLAGLSNEDVALSLQAAYDGVAMTTLREGDKRIPVVAQMRRQQRPGVDRLPELYVFDAAGGPAVPLGSFATVDVHFGTERLRRLDRFRTVTVIAYPQRGKLPSEVMAELDAGVADFMERLPPGYDLVVSGEHAKQQHGFRNLSLVLAVSTVGIFLALVFQFRDVVKPLLVLAGVPFGFAGGIAGLVVMGASFSFMAFLGIIALVGVIVSHIILLFDFIETMRERGEPLEQALLDAGVVRLRPVLITVGATMMALVPLALHGGPMWRPLCYAQIAGLAVATVVSLGIIPVLYAICVEDLRIIRWETSDDGPT